jgi:oligopeptide transport system substrate-binding protein
VQLLDPQDYSRVARETEAHLTSYGWCADYPDPENFLDVLFHSESEFNVAGYSNPEIDALLEEARTELDPARRLALYQEIETALLADTAAIPFRHSVIDVLVSERVNGFVLSPMGEIDLRLLTLSEVEEGE